MNINICYCRLSGSAAVKAKNVCLQLVDNHTGLTNSGVVQLFTLPHPQKIVPSPYWSKSPPRLRLANLNGKPGPSELSQYTNGNLFQINSSTDYSEYFLFFIESDRSVEKGSEDDDHSSGVEEEEIQVAASSLARSSPLALSRLLSRSRGSLLSTEDAVKLEKTTSQTIVLPKDYNPISALAQVETMHSFINKVSQKTYSPKMTTSDGAANYKQVLFLINIYLLNY